MRSVRSAICTSGEPVSPSWVRNCSIRLFLRSTASGIDEPPIATPQGAWAPTPGRVPKTSCFVSRYGSSVSRGGPEVKLQRPGSAVLARGSHVERNLTAQIVDARKLPLLPKAAEKNQSDPLAIEIASEIEHVRLHGELVHAERGPHAHVDDGPVGLTGYEDLADVDAYREAQGAIRPHVGRRV